MKNQFLVVAIAAIFSLNACGQEIPDKVKSALLQKFPTASDVKWGKESSTEFEAEFTQDAKKLSVNFSEEGIWLETETEIAIGDIPEVVKSAFYAKFGKDQKVKSAFKIEKSDAFESYEIEYKSGLLSKEIVFDSKGNVK